MTLEKLLDNRRWSLTDKILYFPCLSNLPDVMYLRYHNFRRKKKLPIDVTYIAVKDKQYKQIAEAMYEAVTNVYVDLWRLDNKSRKALYDKYSKLLGEYHG